MVFEDWDIEVCLEAIVILSKILLVLVLVKFIFLLEEFNLELLKVVFLVLGKLGEKEVLFYLEVKLEDNWFGIL